MLSTYEILPTHSSVTAGISVPVVVSVSPLDANASVFQNSEIKLPRCNRCFSYLSPVCAYSPEKWYCTVCSQVMMIKEPIPQEQLQNNVVEIVQSAEYQPLQHAIFVFTPHKQYIKDFLSHLPPHAPLTIVTYTDSLNIIPTGFVSQLISEFDSIPFPESSIPFEKAEECIIKLLPELMEYCWLRIFLSTPSNESPKPRLTKEFKKKYKEAYRIDLFFFGTSYSPYLSEIIQACPGLSKVFNPYINIDDLPAFLQSDIEREFAFQLLAMFRSGVAYSTKFIPSPYLASEVQDNVVHIPVLPSLTASLSFEVTPPEIDNKLRYQSMQCIVEFIRWNPKTNRLSKLKRIISSEFKISNSLSTVLNSASPTMIFYSWLKEAQSLSPSEMSDHIENKLKKLAPVLIHYPHLRPVVKMAFIAKSHPALTTMFWDRLTMGSLLSLSSPKAVDAQFSYNIEIWKDINTYVETVFSVEEKKRKGDFIFVVKSFPSLFIFSESGNVDIPKDSPIDKSINKYIEQCKPLNVKLVQTQLSQVSELLSIDEEEDLPKFLKEVGLESMYNEIV